MPFPIWFRPEAPKDLIRIGSPGDGGYVLPERVLDATSGLLSMGLCDDWSFEEDVHKRTGVPVVVFDHSVDTKFWIRRFLGSSYHGLRELDLGKLKRAWRFRQYPRFFNDASRRHVRKAIGRSEHGFTSLEDAMKIAGMENDILLKIDIEGAEYRITDQIVAHRKRFCAIAMELHEIDLHEDRIQQFLNDLSDDFLLVHFHPNNCTTYGPADMTIVVEISLMNRSLLAPDEELAQHDLPIPGLDARNVPGAPDILVRFE